MVNKINKLSKTWSMYLYIGLFVVASVYVGALFYNSAAYDDKIYPGISIAGTLVGGKTKEEARDLISKKSAEFGDTVILQGSKGYKLSRKELILEYDVQKTVDEAFEIGRNDQFIPWKKYNENLSMEISPDHEKLTKELIDITKSENESVEDALIFMKKGKLKTQKENPGKRVLLAENIETILRGLGDFQNHFELESKTVDPGVKESDIEAAKDDIQKVLSRQLSLKNDGKKYDLSEKDLVGFISFQNIQKNSSSAFLLDLNNLFPPLQANDNVKITFDRQAIRDWVLSFSKNIDIEPKNAKLSGSGGKVTVVTDSVDGKKVKTDELVDRLAKGLDEDLKEIDIPVEVTKSEVASENLDKLGLKGLISTGWTDFSGSPHNRQVNVSVGASKFNGVLIKPGQNFSFDDTLGPVEAYTGYLPELVILKDKTVPEYGGGLCQVSSTAFRAALNAGLPILERSAHAYPVGYYKPYGVDATIYLPSPDLVFKNDTPGYILIQTHINGNKLYFDFYGTKKDITIKFAGDEAGTQGVSAIAEGLTPTITEPEARGEGSFTATFYRLMYDPTGKLIKTNHWVSKYDSPKKYPH